MKKIYEKPLMICEALELNEAVAACSSYGSVYGMQCHVYPAEHIGTYGTLAVHTVSGTHGEVCKLLANYSDKNGNGSIEADKEVTKAFSCGIKTGTDINKREHTNSLHIAALKKCTCFLS